jgi:hypothetical protein
MNSNPKEPMMRKPRAFTIQPHQGAFPLTLGMSRPEVHELLGKPGSVSRNIEWFFENGLQIEYKQGRTVFIQVSRGCGLTARYKGVDLLKLPATKAVALVSKEADYDGEHWELGYTYRFPKLALTLWRPVMPSNSKDPNGRYFDTVAVAVEGYWG